MSATIQATPRKNGKGKKPVLTSTIQAATLEQAPVKLEQAPATEVSHATMDYSLDTFTTEVKEMSKEQLAIAFTGQQFKSHIIAMELLVRFEGKVAAAKLFYSTELRKNPEWKDWTIDNAKPENKPGGIYHKPQQLYNALARHYSRKSNSAGSTREFGTTVSSFLTTARKQEEGWIDTFISALTADEKELFAELIQ